MQMILWDQEQLKRLDLREMDVAACMLKEQWGHGWRFCKRDEISAVISVRETALVMSDTSRLLNSLYPELAQSVSKAAKEESESESSSESVDESGDESDDSN
jgi:hypothetical protein